MREAFTNIGEIGITVDGRDYLFRPSLFNIAKISSPERLPVDLQELQKRKTHSLLIAVVTLKSCCIDRPKSDKYLSKLCGYWIEENGELIYKRGDMPISNIVILALKLLVAGMIGKPGARGSGGEPAKSFDAADYSSAAVAHLSVSFEDAKHMTMIEFQKAINSKFPDENEGKYPTQEEHDAMINIIESAA